MLSDLTKREETGVKPTNGHAGQSAEEATTTSAQGGGLTGKVTSRTLLHLLELQGKRCALTGWPLTPQTVSLDHVVPLTEGGADDMSNVQLVHATINSMKGTMSQAEFIKHCKAVASHCMFA